MNDLDLLELAKKLFQNLTSKEEQIISLSMKATSNNEADTSIDLNNSKRFLDSFRVDSKPSMCKPKGNVLILLSYNEPLLLSIVPIFCALAMGNKVIVRPSSKNSELFRILWNIDGCGLLDRLVILDFHISELPEYVKDSKAVYFFGSYEHSKDVYKLCAEYNVEYIPEVETADIKIINYETKNFDIVRDIYATLENSYTHLGKICQRISGVFVKETMFDAYLEELKAYMCLNGYKKVKTFDDNSILSRDLFAAQPKEVFLKDSKSVAVCPDIQSEYVKKAYFAMNLWIVPFTDLSDLLLQLNRRKFFHGVTIRSNDSLFTEEIINKTNFSRYTLNDSHCDISSDSGWGGNWPSGSGGYKSWYETFSNRFTVIR